MNYVNICELNPDLSVKMIDDSSFSTFGKIIGDFDFTRGIEYATLNSQIPETGNIYTPSDALLEYAVPKKEIERLFYAGMTCQVGLCNGNNSHLNGLEYHKGSELLVAVTDLVLLLGKIQDMRDDHYNSKNIAAFFVPQNTAIELYATTLHFSPCKVHSEGFKAIIILPSGTNYSLDESVPKNKLIAAKNKWLIAHADATRLVERGVLVGIEGVNLEVKIV